MEDIFWNTGHVGAECHEEDAQQLDPQAGLGKFVPPLLNVNTAYRKPLQMNMGYGYEEFQKKVHL